MEAVLRECRWCLPRERNPVEYLAAGGCLERLHVRVYYLCEQHCRVVRALMDSSELYCHSEDEYPVMSPWHCRIAEIIIARCDEQGQVLGDRAQILTAPCAVPS